MSQQRVWTSQLGAARAESSERRSIRTPRDGRNANGHNEAMIELVQRHRDAILEIAARRGASDVRVFGSVARGDAGADSDIDFLVRFAETASLWDRGGLWSELHELLGRDIDIADEATLRDELRDDVLREAVAI